MRIFITENGSILKYDTADNSWSILVPPNNLQNLAKWQVIPTTCTPPYLTERQRRDIMTKRNFYPENLITQFSVINSNSTNVKEIYVENISSTKFADVGTIQLRTTLGDSALTEAVTTVQSGPRKGSVYFPLLYSINFIDFAKTAEATFSIKDINNMEVITALWSC